jgi:hypothetical protein
VNVRVSRPATRDPRPAFEKAFGHPGEFVVLMVDKTSRGLFL